MKRNKRLPIPIITTFGAIIAVMAILVIARIFFLPKIEQSPDYLSQFTMDSQSRNQCEKFMPTLPEKMGNYHRENNIYLPENQLEHNVEIRCGINKPVDFKPTSQIELVNGVNWYVISSDIDTSPQKSAGLIWVAVDRPIYIAIWIPADASTGPIEDLSRFIAINLPSHKVEHHMSSMMDMPGMMNMPNMKDMHPSTTSRQK